MKKKYPLSALASLLQAELVLKGKDIEVEGLAPLEKAHETQLSFLSNPRYRSFLEKTQAAAVLISREFADACPVSVLIVKDPYVAFAKVGQLFDTSTRPAPGVDRTASIDASVRLPPSVSIGPFVVIKKDVHIAENVIIGAHCVIEEDCKIAEGTELKAQVTLYPRVKIGKNCIIHSGAVLGSDGFGLANENGRWIKVPQLGGVSLGDDVEIGANTTIDRGALEDTLIHNNVKIDNQVQIAHNVVIGEGTAMAAQVGIAGSSVIGRHCLLGGKVGVSGHIHLADQVMVTAMSGVSHSIEEKGIYSASIPARPVREWNKTLARLNRLEEWIQKVKKIMKKLNGKEEAHEGT